MNRRSEADEARTPPGSTQRGLRRALERPFARTALGLAVLGAIIGGLLAFEQLSGDAGSRLVVPPNSSGLELVTEEPGIGALDDRAPRIGEQAPQFALRDPDGAVHRLEDYRGQVVWVNFWATWCEPCKRELPDIQRLYDEYRGRGLVVLEVNFQEGADEARGFWEELGLTLPVLLDRAGDVYDQYRLRGLPDSFFIDREGALRAIQLGFLSEDQMRARLAEAGLGP